MNILLIVEGNEEETLFKILENKGFSHKYNIKLENVKGYGRIAPYFQSELSNEYYDCIICIYDVDNRLNETNSPYNLVRRALKNVLITEDNIDSISVCTNPNIVQFFLLGADKLENVSLQYTSKITNTEIIHKYWDRIGNKKNYDAESWQLQIIEDSYTYGEYKVEDLLKNAEELNLDYKKFNPASNLLPLIKALINGDDEYFKKAINVKERKK